MNELALQQWVIVLRSGPPIFLEAERAQNLTSALEQKTASIFVKVGDRTVSSSDILAVYGPEAYADYVKVQQGMWQCEYQVWHKKKGECECKMELRRKREAEMDRVREELDRRPMTPEEKKTANEWFRNNREAMIAKGLMRGGGTQPRLKRSRLIEYEKKFGHPYAVPDGYVVEEDMPKLTSVT